MEGVEVERWKVEGGWMMGAESNGPGQVKHPEKQIFHTTSARDCRGRPPTYLNVATVYLKVKIDGTNTKTGRFVKGPKFKQYVGTVSHLLFHYCKQFGLPIEL